MFNWRKKRNFWGERKITEDIAPDEIFLDSSNLPEFDTNQFEGRIEKPIPKSTIFYLGIGFLAILIVFSGKIWNLQLTKGSEYKERSQNNNLRQEIQFSERGIIYDRLGVELVWNEINEENSDYSNRKYINKVGLSHLLGFINYPKKDSSGKYYEFTLLGKSGIEESFNKIIGGENGLKITEVDVFKEIKSESTIRPVKNGDDIVLSIDERIQSQMYKLLRETAREARFQGGAGVIMNVETGELLAITSYPEYDSQVLTDGVDSSLISEYNKDTRKPFLNRATSGLYTPGSIVKPFMALAALEEEIIPPTKSILSTGELIVPNPYFPDQETIFKDWKAHGWVDMREALAVSSNIYFYTIGGGHNGQKGLGISKIEKYMKEFGFGSKTKINFSSEKEGVVPNPKWKREIFNDDWRLGDTYITAIGQFGFQITPIQAVQGAAMIANSGKVVRPTILKKTEGKVDRKIDIDASKFEIVQEGMRGAVITGTAKALNFSYIKIAAKTGTAEVGVLKESVNSWIIGYWPDKKPKYAFAVVLERRASKNPVGGLLVMTKLIDWMHINTPEYLEN